MWQISVGNDKRSDLVFSGACWLPNWYQAFGRVTPYISCVYILRTGKWWGVFGQSTISSSSLHLTKQQKMGWVEDLRNISFLHNVSFYHSLLFESNLGPTQEWVSWPEGKSQLGALWCCGWHSGASWTTLPKIFQAYQCFFFVQTKRLSRPINVLLLLLELHLLPPQLTWQALIHLALKQ